VDGAKNTLFEDLLMAFETCLNKDLKRIGRETWTIPGDGIPITILKKIIFLIIFVLHMEI